MILRGCGTALVTPFRSDGSLDEETLSKLVEWQIESGIHFLVACGTTAETPTLNHEEWLRVIGIVCQTAAGRVPVVAGCTHNATLEAVARAGEAASVPGVSGLLTANPFYNKPSQEGLFRHYSAIAEATDLPIILYSIPSRCGVEIGLPLVERLRSKYSHVRWIKEAGGSVDRVDQFKRALGDDIVVLSGDDSLTLAFMAAGAEGVISVASNVVPRHIARLVRLMRENDVARASELHRRLYPLYRALFIEPSPVPVKAALAIARIIGSEAVRLPLCRMEPANRAILARALAALRR